MWGCRCEICGNDFRQADIQVDHINGNHSLKDIDDLENFILNIVFTTHDDLQIVCKGCHKIKNHSERYGMSFEEAKLEKDIIETCKRKDLKQWLMKEHGYKEDQVSNSGKRKQCVREVLSDS